MVDGGLASCGVIIIIMPNWPRIFGLRLYISVILVTLIGSRHVDFLMNSAGGVMWKRQGTTKDAIFVRILFQTKTK